MAEVLVASLVILAVVQSVVIGTTELWKLYRGKGTITYYNIPFPTGKSSYAPGEIVTFTANVAVLDLAAERSTYVVTPELHRAGCEVVYQLTTFTTASTEHKQNIIYAITIPRDTPSGTYEVRGVSRWSNDSSAGGIAWNTQSFTVDAGDDDAHDPCG